VANRQVCRFDDCLDTDVLQTRKARKTSFIEVGNVHVQEMGRHFNSICSVTKPDAVFFLICFMLASVNLVHEGSIASLYGLY
jgi:hypothetical protein